jgi:uncharacterized RDD family membrane protein YckC
MTSATSAGKTGIPSFQRRMGGVLYEALAVIALWILASAIITALFGSATAPYARLLLQLLAIAIISAYFVWCWSHGGQTLAMKTWRIRVVNSDGQPLTMRQALRRYLLACAGMAMGGIGLWWALLDRDGAFLHDRLGDTRLILIAQP